eukprot:CAMPEP_0184485246 /NCGR_PEP_ID=MMETSP0113_2-20130426/6878_1 /TAXON_ID=91329 /ORGANISM="Norrisiella sphaerica, Strain BC52" /LENGTH=320 /DNA_ID=CAMNT_0026866623 /DNA_START=807 /DNA_END=1771 /DNA_ORIENTATION=-
MTATASLTANNSSPTPPAPSPSLGRPSALILAAAPASTIALVRVLARFTRSDGRWGQPPSALARLDSLRTASLFLKEGFLSTPPPNSCLSRDKDAAAAAARAAVVRAPAAPAKPLAPFLLEGLVSPFASVPPPPAVLLSPKLREARFHCVSPGRGPSALPGVPELLPRPFTGPAELLAFFRELLPRPPAPDAAKRPEAWVPGLARPLAKLTSIRGRGDAGDADDAADGLLLSLLLLLFLLLHAPPPHQVRRSARRGDHKTRDDARGHDRGAHGHVTSDNSPVPPPLQRPRDAQDAQDALDAERPHRDARQLGQRLHFRSP